MGTASVPIFTADVASYGGLLFGLIKTGRWLSTTANPLS